MSPACSLQPVLIATPESVRAYPTCSPSPAASPRSSAVHEGAEKCKFHRSTISFLGYILNFKGICVEEAKVTAVLNWLIPKTVKELQRFLGFVNLYRRFIRNF
ncbi:hypothetical protein JZ751_004493 [Albula glossodonta]|uniref:Reverse transcriptase n=1 Tax=Albula glossodonta TaxID=121402 RepID=A0A8T2MYK8_9TELE|nr:hypothetical protein JZ751_004493 [Albula glossodonta]